MKFEKVSFETFKKSLIDLKFLSEDASLDKNVISYWEEQYDKITIPERKTTKSAGYDFALPFDIKLEPHQEIIIPTGIKVDVDDDKLLALHIRSSLAFKHGIRTIDTVGNIDSDYYNNINNEGHIMSGIVNGPKEFKAPKGMGYVQGIIIKYHTVDNDRATGERIGGIGSTTLK